MTSYERVRRTLDHQPVDRVPYDIQAEDIVWQRLQDHLGLESRDAVREHFGIDRWSVGPRYIGPHSKPSRTALTRSSSPAARWARNL